MPQRKYQFRRSYFQMDYPRSLWHGHNSTTNGFEDAVLALYKCNCVSRLHLPAGFRIFFRLSFRGNFDAKTIWAISFVYCLNAMDLMDRKIEQSPGFISPEILEFEQRRTLQYFEADSRKLKSSKCIIPHYCFYTLKNRIFTFGSIIYVASIFLGVNSNISRVIIGIIGEFFKLFSYHLSCYDNSRI